MVDNLCCEDIDYTICANDKNTITHIQLKYSTTVEAL